MGKLGWPFADPSSQDDTGNPLEMVNATKDKVYGSKHVRDLYFKADKGEEKRVDQNASSSGSFL
jgi:glutathionyl-hydroquinone reductase